jgi:hypothetical protein
MFAIDWLLYFWDVWIRDKVWVVFVYMIMGDGNSFELLLIYWLIYLLIDFIDLIIIIVKVIRKHLFW